LGHKTLNMFILLYIRKRQAPAPIFSVSFQLWTCSLACAYGIPSCGLDCSFKTESVPVLQLRICCQHLSNPWLIAMEERILKRKHSMSEMVVSVIDSKTVFCKYESLILGWWICLSMLYEIYGYLAVCSRNVHACCEPSHEAREEIQALSSRSAGHPRLLPRLTRPISRSVHLQCAWTSSSGLLC
jgi:hypothetical protein